MPKNGTFYLGKHMKEILKQTIDLRFFRNDFQRKLFSVFFKNSNLKKII
jgi:hypothetical protein